MKAFTLISAAALAMVASAASAQPPAAPVNPRVLAPVPAPKSPPANLLPTAVGGAVVYVHNLEAQRQWYQTMLGFRIQTTYIRDGVTFEYIMTTGSGTGGAFMGLMQSAARPQGMNTNTRVVLPVPDPKALADYMAKQGVYVREAVAGSAYMLLDPEGNQIEIYRLATPAPAPAPKAK